MPSERDRPDTPTALAAAVELATTTTGGTDRGRDQQAGVVTAASAVVAGSGGSSAHSILPGVLSDVPVAVLVIDQKNSSVIYANTAAVELAGNVGLPVDVDTWGAAAGLTDVSGAPLASSSGPLSTVAQGRPVTGEAVRLSPGTSTLQVRADADDGRADQLLWVTGFPLSQAGSDEQLALVVFLQLDPVDDTADPEAYLQALRERAVIATDITFTITDPREPDNPLVWVNPSFTRITGYEADEVVGRNCRFLQGPATDPEAVAQIRAALAERRTLTTTLLNYRKDGTAFWNQLSVSPVFDGEGSLVSFVGVQTDVTERVRVEREREAAFAAEQAARQEAELARVRLRAGPHRRRTGAGRSRAGAEPARPDGRGDQRADLHPRHGRAARPARRAVRAAAGRLGVRHAPRRLGEVPIRRSATGTAARTSSRSSRPCTCAHLRARVRRACCSMATSRPVLLDALTPEVRAGSSYPGALEAFRPDRRQLRADRAHGGPPPDARGHRADPRRPTRPPSSRSRSSSPRSSPRRAALPLDNVRLYRQEHTVAETLQRSLLPDLPEVPGWRPPPTT